MNHHRRPSGWITALACLPLLAACGHAHRDKTQLLTTAEEYVRGLDPSPSDYRVPALRGYAHGLAAALESNMDDEAELRRTAEMLVQRQTCMYQTYGVRADAHAQALSGALLGDPTSDPRYLRLLHATQKVPAMRGDACNY